ncbi:MAG: XRE family transcriptional regulator [Bacteroidota bacterium]
MSKDIISLKHILGLKIRDLRLEKRLSFQEVADKSGLSISYLSEIEKGKKYPKGDKILQLSEALDTSYDDLVSLKVSKRIQPVVDLLRSDFFKEFPLELFGLDPQKLIDLVSVSPEKINSFITSIALISRNYEVNREHFYYAALRSYQEMHDNYFPEIEKEVKALRKLHPKLQKNLISRSVLISILEDDFRISVDFEGLSGFSALKNLRSYLSGTNLLIGNNLTEAQECFLISREIGFQLLKLKERPEETPPQKSYPFDYILNNYKASYFAAALLMPEHEVVSDVRKFANLPKWNAKALLSFTKKYRATPEMLMQRLTNLLPTYFGIKNLFFLRFVGTDDFSDFVLTKELHLSGIHNPHANALNEHYCRRWISIGLIKELRSNWRLKGTNELIAAAQISRYHDTPNEYLCLTIAFPNVSNPSESMSVTIGVFIDKPLKKKIRFLTDKEITVKEVNTTCERCSIANCGDRIAPPIHIEKERRDSEIIEALEKLKNHKPVSQLPMD